MTQGAPARLLTANVKVPRTEVGRAAALQDGSGGTTAPAPEVTGAEVGTAGVAGVVPVGCAVVDGAAVMGRAVLATDAVLVSSGPGAAAALDVSAGG